MPYEPIERESNSKMEYFNSKAQLQWFEWVTHSFMHMYKVNILIKIHCMFMYITALKANLVSS